MLTKTATTTAQPDATSGNDGNPNYLIQAAVSSSSETPTTVVVTRHATVYTTTHAVPVITHYVDNNGQTTLTSVVTVYRTSLVTVTDVETVAAASATSAEFQNLNNSPGPLVAVAHSTIPTQNSVTITATAKSSATSSASISLSPSKASTSISSSSSGDHGQAVGSASIAPTSISSSISVETPLPSSPAVVGPSNKGCVKEGDDCSVEGELQCSGSKFAQCNFGKWVVRSCGTGTVCQTLGDLLFCDYKPADYVETCEASNSRSKSRRSTLTALKRSSNLVMSDLQINESSNNKDNIQGQLVAVADASTPIGNKWTIILPVPENMTITEVLRGKLSVSNGSYMVSSEPESEPDSNMAVAIPFIGHYI